MLGINAISLLLEPRKYIYAESRQANLRRKAVGQAAQAEFFADVGDGTAESEQYSDQGLCERPVSEHAANALSKHGLK